MDLVEEEHRPPAAGLQPLAGPLDHRAHLGPSRRPPPTPPRTRRRRRSRPAARASSCRCPAARAGSSSAAGPPRSRAAAPSPTPAAAPGRPARRASSGASGWRAAPPVRRPSARRPRRAPGAPRRLRTASPRARPRPLAAQPLSAASASVVQQPVGGDRVAAGRGGGAREVGEATAGLLHDQHRRGQVPQRHGRIRADLGLTVGDQHVLPEVAEPARAPAAVRQRQQPVQPPGRAPFLEAAVGELRVGQIVDRRHPQPPRRGPLAALAHERAAARATPTSAGASPAPRRPPTSARPRPRAPAASPTRAARARSPWCRRSGRRSSAGPAASRFHARRTPHRRSSRPGTVARGARAAPARRRGRRRTPASCPAWSRRRGPTRGTGPS